MALAAASSVGGVASVVLLLLLVANVSFSDANLEERRVLSGLCRVDFTLVLLVSVDQFGVLALPSNPVSDFQQGDRANLLPVELNSV